MTISAFSMCRNAESLYYPIRESVLSALPLVDEFVIAIGKGEQGDKTLELVRSINSPKLKVIETEWDLEAFKNGTVHAQQTDIAKAACSGDWLLYLQADEVIHEKDFQAIRSGCKKAMNEPTVEGFLFNYHHFWGDYEHEIKSHCWYQEEIRLVRNLPEIHSWESAQSFRHITGFDGRSYRDPSGTRKLRVRKLDAHVYHYGWVRPPHIMSKKRQELDRIHSHQRPQYPSHFDYGDLSKINRFEGQHPEVMNDWMNKLDWQADLNHGNREQAQILHKHERLRYRLLTFLEQSFFGGARIATYRNYKVIK